jgi:hypothetical protein
MKKMDGGQEKLKRFYKTFVKLYFQPMGNFRKAQKS